MAVGQRIMRLTNDFVFTATFGEAEHPERVEGMLETFLERGIHVDKLETHLQLEPDMPDDKYGVVDILATLENGDLAQIEMQVYWFRFMPERELFYASDFIYKQLKSGQPYDRLHRVILICIVMHDYVPSIPDRFHTDFMLREKNQPDVVFSDKLQIKVLDLHKFLKQYPWAADKGYVPDLPTLNAMGLEAQWMLLLITESKEVREMLGRMSPP
ncbi:MAG: Rpn family recombination-promoting nuclease/putative transposase, partial [Oscillospiraceae bacterium]|nr:Rpn family recombination-promoting nuclease/putative transposase [Oscillospiraceae bacterium]